MLCHVAHARSDFACCEMGYTLSLLLDCDQSDAADKTFNDAISCGLSLVMVDACVTCDLVTTGLGAMFPVHM
jgi:hypothetical protein